MNAIEVNGVSKQYEGFLLDNVSFTLPRGTILGLVGENGAGKSTTIKLIMNAIPRNGGSIRVLGEDNLSPAFQLVKDDIGVVLDEAYFPEVLTAKQVASMYPMPLKATYAASKRFLLDIAVALGAELKHQNVNVLALCPGGLATTREAMQGIAAQGFWGGATTNPLERVSRQTIDRVERASGVFIPGALNRTLTFFGNLLPRTWVAAAIYHRWSKAQEQWNPVEFSSGLTKG